jgi:LmbE family N-acetylglucosaminyl deacetylase
MRREGRWKELTNACSILGFDLLLPEAGGFSPLTPDERKQNPGHWQQMRRCLTDILARYKPEAVFLPHVGDGHVAHQGAHWLGMDALAAQKEDFTCHIVQMEFWQPNEEPNCMVGVNDADAAILLNALCCHVGEVSRNPYHLRFPAYLADNVRRGSERVAGKGSPGAPMDFAMLYRIDRWKNGRVESAASNRIIGPGESAAHAFD